MSHSITVLTTHGGARADAILAGLAERLELPHIWQNGAGRVQLWLQFDPEHAYDAVVAALEAPGAGLVLHASRSRLRLIGERRTQMTM
jgi:hypothetical protein